MSAIDFGEWVAPDLEIKLGGRTYMVRPPTVEAAKMILASAVYGEVKYGMVKGDVPAEVQSILDSIGNQHPALGDAYLEMVADGVPSANIDRVAVYAVFYWARGKDYADTFANIFWHPRGSTSGDEGEPAPKG